MATLYDPTRDIALRFDSPEAYLAYVKTLPRNFQSYAHNHWNFDKSGGSWFNKVNPEHQLMYLERGSTKYLARAEALINLMRDDGLLSEGHKILQSDVVGVCPNVPNFLAGQPDTMFSFQETEQASVLAPITVYVENAASAEISADALIARGVAILGLVLALKALRPVDLYCFSFVGAPPKINGAFGSVVRIETAPLDLDRATYMLCCPSFYRGIQYATGCYLAGQREECDEFLPWAWSSSPAHFQYVPSCREMLGALDHDVLIPGMYSTQGDYISDPIGWIKGYLKKIKEGTNA